MHRSFYQYSSIILLTGPYFSYAFDVDPQTQAFSNRRIFAYSDTGVPDGIQVDTNGNVFSGCGDGVQVHSSVSLSFPLGPLFLTIPAPSSRLCLHMVSYLKKQVWNPEGTLIGKFFLGTTSSNMIFAGNRLVIMAETMIVFAQIAAEGIKVAFP